MVLTSSLPSSALSLSHPIQASCANRGGTKHKSALWVLDPLTRVGGIGVLLLFVACSAGGANYWYTPYIHTT